MKVSVLFLLFALAFGLAQSQQISEEKIVCVQKDKILNVLKGRDGPTGPPGAKGDEGLYGDKGAKGIRGDKGWPGRDGIGGSKGERGSPGEVGLMGMPGLVGLPGLKGRKGYPGEMGEKGYIGDGGSPGDKGQKGERGLKGRPGTEIKKDIVISLLNDYYIVENGYYNKLYHVTSRTLTDGRTDTGGWGSETAKSGNYIQATFVRPVYVTSVTVAGGYIPSWGHGTRQTYGFMDLEYSADGKIWKKVSKIRTPVGKKMMTRYLSVPVIAQYWRLISTEDKWVGTTEFALKPLMK